MNALKRHCCSFSWMASTGGQVCHPGGVTKNQEVSQRHRDAIALLLCHWTSFQNTEGQCLECDFRGEERLKHGIDDTWENQVPRKQRDFHSPPRGGEYCPCCRTMRRTSSSTAGAMHIKTEVTGPRLVPHGPQRTGQQSRGDEEESQEPLKRATPRDKAILKTMSARIGGTSDENTSSPQRVPWPVSSKTREAVVRPWTLY